MTESGADQEQLGALFVRVTGQSTVSEYQHEEVTVRFSETAEDAEVSAYVDACNKATGLNEAIDVPNRS